jgi:hypothetical protein
MPTGYEKLVGGYKDIKSNFYSNESLNDDLESGDALPTLLLFLKYFNKL